MRIGIDAKRAFNNKTGLGNYARWLIAQLIKYYPEHEYYLFTPKVHDDFKDLFTKIPHVKIIIPDTISGKLMPSLWRTYSIVDICNNLELDVYHGLSNEMPIGIDKFRGLKICTIHDLIFLRYPNYYNNIDRYIYKKKVSNAVNASNIVLACSKQTKEDVIRYLNFPDHKIHVHYQNCSEAFSKKIVSPNESELPLKYGITKPFVLTVGTIEPRKNQLSLVKAFHLLHTKEIQLVLIGRKTDYASEIQTYIDTHALHDNVLMIDNVNQDDLPEIYRWASAFAYISAFEGFGIPVLEAMRSGIPVLLSNQSSLPEVGGDAAIYTHPNDVDEIHMKLKELLYSDELRKTLLEKAIVQINLFENKRLMDELMSFYLNK